MAEWSEFATTMPLSDDVYEYLDDDRNLASTEAFRRFYEEVDRYSVPLYPFSPLTIFLLPSSPPYLPLTGLTKENFSTIYAIHPSCTFPCELSCSVPFDTKTKIAMLCQLSSTRFARRKKLQIKTRKEEQQPFHLSRSFQTFLTASRCKKQYRNRQSSTLAH